MGEFGHDPKGEGEPWKGSKPRTCGDDPFGSIVGVGEEGMPAARLVLVSRWGKGGGQCDFETDKTGDPNFWCFSPLLVLWQEAPQAFPGPWGEGPSG